VHRAGVFVGVAAVVVLRRAATGCAQNGGGDECERGERREFIRGYHRFVYRWLTTLKAKSLRELLRIRQGPTTPGAG